MMACETTCMEEDVKTTCGLEPSLRSGAAVEIVPSPPGHEEDLDDAWGILSAWLLRHRTRSSRGGSEPSESCGNSLDSGRHSSPHVSAG